MKWKDSSNSDTIEDELDSDHLHENPYSSLRKKRFDRSAFLNLGQYPVILYGMGAVILILLIIMFSGGNSNETQLSEIKKKVELLQDRLVILENIEQRIDRLESEQKKMDQFSFRLNQLDTSNALQMKRIAKQLNDLNKRTTVVKPKAAAKKPAKKPSTKTPRFHQVSPGETLYAISRRYGISVDTLRKLNKLAPNFEIYPGQKLLVSP
ncbi:LysM peptidoglycan-binding domain-containing protein [Thermodesulfobacteriota bacterium]